MTASALGCVGFVIRVSKAFAQNQPLYVVENRESKILKGLYLTIDKTSDAYGTRSTKLTKPPRHSGPPGGMEPIEAPFRALTTTDAKFTTSGATARVSPRDIRANSLESAVICPEVAP